MNLILVNKKSKKISTKSIKIFKIKQIDFNKFIKNYYSLCLFLL